MGNRQSVTTVSYRSPNIIRSDNGDILRIKSIETNALKITETEYQDMKRTKGSKIIDYCLLDNNFNGIEECASVLRPPPTKNYTNFLDEFRITKSDVPCTSLIYRPGSVVKELDKALTRFTPDEFANGKLCKIEFQDYNYDDYDLLRCCTTGNKTNCNANLINGYETNHCNIVMRDFCKDNTSNEDCILWLEKSIKRSDDDAFKVYSHYCSEHHDKKICDYFCSYARKHTNHYGAYCDISLKNWCEKNSLDQRCFCVMTPSSRIPDVEQFLGPKECWLSSCSSQSELKWLTTDQLRTRKECQVTSCIINIDNLVLNDDGSIELVNDCVSGSKVSSAIKNDVEFVDIKIKDDKKKIFISPAALLISGSIAALLMTS